MIGRVVTSTSISQCRGLKACRIWSTVPLGICMHKSIVFACLCSVPPGVSARVGQQACGCDRMINKLELRGRNSCSTVCDALSSSWFCPSCHNNSTRRIIRLLSSFLHSTTATQVCLDTSNSIEQINEY